MNENYLYTDAHSLSDRDATVAKVQFVYGDINISKTGSSQRHPSDEADQLTGELIAYARAYIKLGSQLARIAQGRVRHADSVKQDKEKRKAEKEFKSTNFTAVDVNYNHGDGVSTYHYPYGVKS